MVAASLDQALTRPYSRSVASPPPAKGSAQTAATPSPSGTALKLLLAYRDMKQNALASSLGVGPSTISRYVNGKDPIPEGRRMEILRVLGLTPLAWGQAEVLAQRLAIEGQRFAVHSPGQNEIGEGGLPESELTDRDGAQHDTLDADRDDNLAAYLGLSVETIVRETARRLRDRHR